MITSTSIVRRVFAAALVSGGLAVQASQAGAASVSVQYACMSDYFRYCSRHDPDGPGVRTCMSFNGHRLSNICVNALVKAGEVSRAEVSRGASSRRSARAR